MINTKIYTMSHMIRHTPFPKTYFHGTKTGFKIGDVISVGYQCNYYDNSNLKHAYVAATLTAAIWGAELAVGDGRERIYLVEATGGTENDPNVANKRFPGNPTMSSRPVHPFKVIGEVSNWQAHSEEQIQAMKEELQKLTDQGLNVIID